MDKKLDTENLPPYKMWLLPNYKESESLYIFVGHHALADGIGIFSVL